MISRMIIQRLNRRASAVAALLLTLAALTGCSAFNETGRECPDPDADSRSTVAIEFRVHTASELLGRRS